VLYRKGEGDVRWPMFAALYTALTASPTVPDLVQLLDDTRRVDEARPLLEDLMRSGGPRTREWAREVLGRSTSAQPS
jgi:hypothetical protein